MISHPRIGCQHTLVNKVAFVAKGYTTMSPNQIQQGAVSPVPAGSNVQPNTVCYMFQTDS